MALIQSGMPLYPELLNSPAAYKTSDTSRASTTTLAADPDLAVSVIAGAVPLYGTVVISSFSLLCNSRPHRCEAEPRPACARLILPWFACSHFDSSA